MSFLTAEFPVRVLLFFLLRLGLSLTLLGRLIGRPLPLLGLGLRLADEAGEAGRGPGEGDGG